ncbi:MAG TPA: 1-(5-phosphoribosyl)-5-[(5-phosphoribosylamino)methylideneamino]imidazole-4-carboxamide isomerase [Vicinamibacteria bacterium]|nr:1-(5-phosphoribosyl)-5-[(5-phosphoribosylamino)methylideneamino]imidazole-4-carboxamide isomerase [Vicinamibacteria bacterium]
MIVVPAVDLRGGRVVRLRQGRPDEQTVYGLPAEAARRWEDEGAQRLHVVDLDAAFGQAPQGEAVAAVVAAVSIPVEVGGGIRTLDDVRRHLEQGAQRVILGSVAVRDPEVVRAAAQAWPERIAVAIDARDGRVAVDGWTRTSPVAAADLARRVREWGAGRVQYTDVARDGSLGGLDVGPLERLARAASVRITAGGGVATLDDLRALKALEPLGLDEVIVGRALYDGRFRLREAMEASR